MKKVYLNELFAEKMKGEFYTKLDSVKIEAKLIVSEDTETFPKYVTTKDLRENCNGEVFVRPTTYEYAEYVYIDAYRSYFGIPNIINLFRSLSNFMEKSKDINPLVQKISELESELNKLEFAKSADQMRLERKMQKDLAELYTKLKKSLY